MSELELLLSGAVAVLLGVASWQMYGRHRDRDNWQAERAELQTQIHIFAEAATRKPPLRSRTVGPCEHQWMTPPAYKPGSKWDTFQCELCPQKRTVQHGLKP